MALLKIINFIFPRLAQIFTPTAFLLQYDSTLKVVNAKVYDKNNNILKKSLVERSLSRANSRVREIC